MLKGKSFDLPVPFYCLTRSEARDRYRRSSVEPREIKKALESKEFPLVYVPSRFAGSGELNTNAD